MPKQRLTDDDMDRIADLRGRRAYSIASIAQELGCSEGAILWHCNRLGIEPPKPELYRYWDGVRGPLVTGRSGHLVRRFTPAEDERLLALAEGGMSRRRIGKMLGRRTNSVIARMSTLARREERAHQQGERACPRSHPTRSTSTSAAAFACDA
jgi:DNA-binding CsgD family transcriptional regulator